MIKEITSTSNELIKKLAKLKDTKNIKKEGMILIEGEHLIKEAKDDLLFILTLHELEEFNCDQYIVTKDILTKLSSGKSFSRVIGVTKLLKSKAIETNKVVYLNKVQDPGNVGTIFRTSLAFSYFDVVVDSGCAYQYSSKVIQSSQGSIFKLNINNGNINTLKQLKKDGYKIICTCLDPNSKKLSEICKVFNKICVVFGNEGQGIDQEILDLSDIKLIIEMSNIDSLNVAISAGIILYELNKLD